MKIAWIHLTFTWPPRGGAAIDCFEILSRLAKKHSVCLFAPAFNVGFKRFRSDVFLPFPVEVVPFEFWNFTRNKVKESFRKTIEKFSPDVVVIGDAWTMKPHLINSMKGYRVISRYYAYESLCLIRNGQLFRNGEFCSNNMLQNTTLCRACAFKWIFASIVKRRREDYAKIHEFLMALAFLPSYLGEIKNSLSIPEKIIVNNNLLKNILKKWESKITILPSGPSFPVDEANKKIYFDLNKNPFFHLKGEGKKIILVPGRLEDPAKGGEFARRVGRKLAELRQDFLMVFTGQSPDVHPWERFIGWVTREHMPYLFAVADLVFIPSLWPEPFGIVAIEALILGKETVGCSVGGLGEILQKKDPSSIIRPGDVSHAVQVISQRLQKLYDYSNTLDSTSFHKTIPNWEDILTTFEKMLQ